MFKKISFLITTLILINIVNLVSADIVPIKKPSQSKEEKEKKLMVDVLKPLPKPIIKDQIVAKLNISYDKWIKSLDQDKVMIIDTDNFNIFGFC